MSSNWDLWAEFCDSTGRETVWGLKIAEQLVRRKILPCKFALDVGCGTGEFTQVLAGFTQKIKGIDVVDVIRRKSFPFEQVSFESYKEEDCPDVIFFKQSFHLLENSPQICLRYPHSVLVIAQMPKPDWDTNPNWSAVPLNAQLNAQALRETGRQTEVLRMEQEYVIQMSLLNKMFLEGYTSDLRKFTPENRYTLWQKLSVIYNNGVPFSDTLDLIISSPLNKKN